MLQSKTPLKGGVRGQACSLGFEPYEKRKKTSMDELLEVPEGHEWEAGKHHVYHVILFHLPLSLMTRTETKVAS